MSSLWDIKVINMGSDWVDMEVLFGHPDAGPFPEDPNFALQLLTNQAYKYDESYNKISKCPLGDKIPADKSFLPDDLYTHVDDIVKKVIVYKAERIPFNESAAHELMDNKVKELGIDEESDQWQNKWHDFWREYWDDPNNLPVAYYRISVTDPKWIEHISVGMKFDSAAFSQDGPFIEENREVDPESYVALNNSIIKNYFEYKDEKSSKFWEIEVKNKDAIIRYGRIGSSGQKKIKSFDSNDTANKEALKLIKQKTKKGYIEVR